MSNEQALLNCTFGWGKTCSLYYNSIEIAGKSYDLKDLTSIQPSYRSVFGVPSARLELSFGLDHLVLRGIADLDSARLMVSHLQPYCSTTPHAAHMRSRSSRARTLARAQAHAWERTNKMPAILNLSGDSPLATGPSKSLKRAKSSTDETAFDEDQPTEKAFALDSVPKAPIEDTSLTPGETLEAFAQLASNLSTYASPLPTALWQPPHTPRFQPPLHSVHLIPPNQKFDSSSMPIPVVKSSVLPIIHVPVRLQHGECAHYSIGATLCSDRISSSARATYPLLDQGLLILTNRRVLYTGKRCQFTLAYTHLWYVSLLHTAIALHIEGQFRRIIVELEHPHEWASRIELLAFIARRSRPRPELPTVAVAAIPGLNMTVKRRAVKLPAAKNQTVADNITVPLLAERVESRIVDAITIDIDETASQECADHETLDFPDTPELPEAAMSNTPEIADRPTMIDMTVSELAQTPQLEHASTQALRSKSDVANMATREFSLQTQQPEPEHAPTQALRSKSDIANMATREFSLQTQQANRGTQAGSNESDSQEKTTQSLGLSLDEIAKLQAAQPSEPEQEITTSALHDPVLPLTVLPRNKKGSQTPPPEDMDDDDDRTICLRDRKLSQLHTMSLREPVSDRLPDIEITHRRPRVRAPQRLP